MASDTTIGYLPQDGIVHHGRTVHEEVVLAFAGAARPEGRSSTGSRTRSPTPREDDEAATSKLLERYAEVTERFKHLGGYEIDARVADVLKGLGFSLADQQRRTEEFSGGWQMRIALAKLLLARPNLLLMDEPTNHLDLPARNWLEEYLADYPGSVVLVSHDRYFLDATVKRITEVGLKTLTDYHGNYSHYVVEHSRAHGAPARGPPPAERGDREGRGLHQPLPLHRPRRRGRSRAGSSSSTRSSASRSRPSARRSASSSPRPRARGGSCSSSRAPARPTASNVVLRHLDLMVERGRPHRPRRPERRRQVHADADPGRRRPSRRRACASSGTRSSSTTSPRTRRPSSTRRGPCYEEMSSASSVTMVPMIRTILGGFLFSGDDVYKKVAVLSGGERNRLALAKMLLTASNVLLLDEPTNHLDLDSKEVLLDALDDYGGTLVFVSHDRYFVDKLATKVIEVGGGEAPLYPGGYEDFLYWKKQREAGATATRAFAGVRAKARGPGRRDRLGRHGGPHPSFPEGFSLRTPSAARPRSRSAKPSRPRRRQHPTPPPPPNPLAPRLRPSGASPERQALERELKKTKARLARAREARHGERAGGQGARGADGLARLLRRPRPRRPGRRGAPEADVGDGRPHGPVGGPAGRGRREDPAARGRDAGAPALTRPRRSRAGKPPREQEDWEPGLRLRAGEGSGGSRRGCPRARA